MTAIFADTSAVIKRYITEIGSTRVGSWIEPEAGNVIVISELATVEVYSALARRHREGTISTEAARLLQNDFLHHVETEYLVVLIDSSLLSQSRDLITMYPLRTLDAIQLACALQARAALGEPITFASADRRLLEVALAEGVVTENVEAPASP